MTVQTGSLSYSFLPFSASTQWCIAKNGGGYTQRGLAKGLKVPCLFMITEVSIRCRKKPRGWYTPYTRVYPPQYTTASTSKPMPRVSLESGCHLYPSVLWTELTLPHTGILAANCYKLSTLPTLLDAGVLSQRQTQYLVHR